MMKYKSIVISGQIASGTTTAAQTLAEKLNLPYRSAGDFFRKYMISNNIPLYDKDKIPDEIETQIDNELTALAKKGAIVESHYGGYFNRDNKEILKVLLTCADGVRYQRSQIRIHTHQESIDEIKKREEGLEKKFRKLYADENFLDQKFFDLVIDTTATTKEEVAEKILNRYVGK